MQSQLTAKHLELIELVKETPLQLWNRFDKDLVSQEKIIVPTELAFAEPQKTIDGLAAFCSLRWKDSKRVEFIKNLIVSSIRPFLNADEQEAHGFKIEYKKKSPEMEVVNN
jgi:hypothetical protein